MSTTVDSEKIENEQTASFTNADDAGEWQPYRAISRSAVVSLALGVLSLLGLVFPSLLFLPLGAIAFGLIARSAIAKYPAELTGRTIATLGAVLGVVLFVGGVALHTTIYLTEVPEGFERVTFYELQPDKLNKRELIPKKAIELNNKPIFVKGYVHPGVQGSPTKVSHFVLVPDMGTCCFGGQPKMTDMIEIHGKEGVGVKWSPQTIKLWGTFKLSPPRSVGGLTDVVYALEADGIK